MVRSFGIATRSAQEQLQRAPRRIAVEPLPAPYAPARVAPSALGIADPGDPVSFFVLGDVGGIKSPGPQNAVSTAMQRRQEEAAFVLILGDVVYFNGQESALFQGQQTGYGDQFYEAYAKLLKPIVAFPGNHDGDPQPADSTLGGFLSNFCDSHPNIPPDDPHLEYGRHTQTLPYPEWTLELAAATIVAVYSNVPNGGYLYPEQVERLTAELAEADPAKPVIVGIHHPPYSLDHHHGGSRHMGEALDQAFGDSGRPADLVLSGHVHDYQRFTRTLRGQEIPYVVAGAGGYHNLHRLPAEIEPGDEPAEGIVYEAGYDDLYGFLKLTIDAGEISGEYVGVRPGAMPDGSDPEVLEGLDIF